MVKINFSSIEKIPSIYLFTILFIVTFLLYGASLFNGFVWDDQEQIVTNSAVHSLSNISSIFGGSTFNSGGSGQQIGIYYKPFMNLSFAINYFIWSGNPFGFHLFDIFLHAINGTLVFLLLKKLFDFEKIPFAKPIPFLLALIFIVHPANVESVAYISSTQEVLYMFFLLLSLLLTLSFFKKNKLVIIFAINILILSSLLSKETGVLTIPFVWLLSFMFKKSKFLILFLSSILTFVIYLFLRLIVAQVPISKTSSSIIPIANATLSERLTTIPYELFSYLRLFFFPKNLFISQHIVVNNISDPKFYLTLPVIIVFIALLILGFVKFKSKLYIFFIIWLFISMSILLNILPLDMTIAERWLYSPMIGLLGIIGIILEKTIKGKKSQTITIIFLSLILFIFFLRSFLRTNDWKNNYSLFSKDIQYSYNSFDLQNNYGYALFLNGEYQKAEEHFKKSIELSQKWWTSYNNLGVIYQRQGKIEDAKKMYLKSIKNNDYYLGYENLATIKLRTEKPKDVISFTDFALKRLPNNETLNKVAAIAYYNMNNFGQARFYAERAYKLNQSQDNYLLLNSINKNK